MKMNKRFFLNLSLVLAIVMSLSTISFAIGKAQVKSVKFASDKITLEVGGSQKLQVTVNPSGISRLNFTWSSSDSKVVSVNNEGTVSALKVGKATISVKAKSGSAASTCTVMVVEKKQLPPVNLSMYFIGTNEQDGDALVSQEMSKQIKSRINATVKLNFLDWGAWDQKTNLLLASGEPMDVMFQANWLGASYSNNVGKGYLLPLNDLIQKYGKETKAVIPEFLFRGVTINGKIYGIPTYKEVGATEGVVIVKSLVDKYKINMSKINKWADLDPILKMLHEKEPQRVTYTGFVRIDKSAIVQRFAGNDIPVGPFFDGTKVMLETEQPYYTENCKKANSYYKSGYLVKDVLTNFDVKGIMSADKGAVMWAGLKPGKDKELSKEYGVEVVQKEISDVLISSDEGAGSILSIAATSENPERAMMLINLLYTDKKLVNTLAFGVEGKHFVKKAANTIDYPNGVTAENVTYNHGIAWQFGNQYLNYLWTNEDPKKWDKFKAYANRAKAPKLMGFVFNTEPVKSQIATVANVKKQYADAVEKGAISDVAAYVKKYNSELKKAGIDKIMKEMQKQIDAFVAKKK